MSYREYTRIEYVVTLAMIPFCLVALAVLWLPMKVFPWIDKRRRMRG